MIGIMIEQISKGFGFCDCGKRIKKDKLNLCSI